MNDSRDRTRFTMGAKQFIRRSLQTFGVDLVRHFPPGEIHYASTHFVGEDIRTILDIGANSGFFSKCMSARFPLAKIYPFEPLAEPCAAIRAKMSGHSQCKIFNCALGNSNSQTTIHHNGYSPSSSILPMNDLHQEAFPVTAVSSKVETIQVRRLDDMAAELEIEDDLFVKIDVQGFEKEVILGGAATLARAKVMIVETSFQPLYQGQPLFDDIYQMVKGMGFTYAGNWEQLIDPRTDRILQADAIFFRAVQ